ncbi:MAG: glycosyltransferase family 2 protein [Pirellulales bacterium]
MLKRRITVLIPAFNEASNISALIDELNAATNGLHAYDFTYLFVDDGSTDETTSILESIADTDPKVAIIELSRNFGKEMALTAGISAVNCDAVIIMDADLQHPPRYIADLIQEWEAGYEIVSTCRVKMEEQPFLRWLGSTVFYALLNSISEFRMEPGTTDFRLLDRLVIDSLKKFTERNRLFRGLIDWMGFKKTTIVFEAPARHAGKARYSYSRLIRLALNSFMAFSLAPLKIAGYIGLFVIVVFGGLLTFMVTDKFFGDAFGFSPLSFVIVSNVIMNGIVLGCIGLVALYIGHIHTEVIGRPLFLIRKRIGRNVLGPSTDSKAMSH